MKTKDKTVRTIERMREIRDQLSLEIMNMSLMEEKEFIERELKKLKSGRLATGNTR